VFGTLRKLSFCGSPSGLQISEDFCKSDRVSTGLGFGIHNILREASMRCGGS